MKKIYIKIILSIVILCSFGCISFYTNADDIEVEGLAISKKLTTGEVEHTNRRIKFLGSHPGEFWKNYRDAHEDLSFWEKLASGIIGVDDIFNYLVFVIQFLSQLGLLVGVFFIMYAGYKYMLSVFNGGKTASSTLKNAIIGVIIVIFSYAIMKILISFIGLN